MDNKKLEIIKSEPNNGLAEMYINIVLVLLKLRPSSLLEYANVGSDYKYDFFMEKIKDFIGDSKINITYDKESLKEYPRNFVSLPETKMSEDVGKNLGFLCWNFADFGNQNIDRGIGYIYCHFDGRVFQIYTEICPLERRAELEKHIENLSEAWNGALAEYGFEFIPEFRISTSYVTLFSRVGDFDFMRDNVSEYEEIVANSDMPELANIIKKLAASDENHKRKLLIDIMDYCEEDHVLFNSSSYGGKIQNISYELIFIFAIIIFICLIIFLTRQKFTSSENIELFID